MLIVNLAAHNFWQRSEIRMAQNREGLERKKESGTPAGCCISRASKNVDKGERKVCKGRGQTCDDDDAVASGFVNSRSRQFQLASRQRCFLTRFLSHMQLNIRSLYLHSLILFVLFVFIKK